MAAPGAASVVSRTERRATVSQSEGEVRKESAMGQHVSRDDYEWVYTEEPHRTRRKQILGEKSAREARSDPGSLDGSPHLVVS